MSAVHHTFIRCDQCSETYGSGRAKEGRLLRDIRADAKTRGWFYYGLHGEKPKDFCPRHKPARKRRKGNNGNSRKGAG